MSKRILLATVALVGLPLLTAMTVVNTHLLFNSGNLTRLFTPTQGFFLVGCVMMIAIFLRWHHTLIVLYVLAHELTHALAGITCLARIKRISVKKTGGFVELNKSNIWITLAPYMVPLYLVILLIIRYFIGWIDAHWYEANIWYCLTGITFTFHILYTAVALISNDQPDIHDYGPIFSYWFILIGNAGVIFLALAYLCDTHTIPPWRTLYQTLTTHYHLAWDYLQLIVDKATSILSS